VCGSARSMQLGDAREDMAAAERHLQRVAERVATGAQHDIDAEEAWRVLRGVAAVEAPGDVASLLAAQQSMRATLQQAIAHGRAQLALHKRAAQARLQQQQQQQQDVHLQHEGVPHAAPVSRAPREVKAPHERAGADEVRISASHSGGTAALLRSPCVLLCWLASEHAIVYASAPGGPG
jgi:hypothetical protein